MDEKTTFNAGEIEALDVQTMRGMTEQDYRVFVSEGRLVYVDDHGMLRSTAAQYPLATTRRQLEVLIEELRVLGEQMA